jgi:hypothetical protein
METNYKISDLSDWIPKRLDMFNGIFEVIAEECQNNPEKIQEMADQGYISDPDVIEICQKHDIKFKI